MEKLKQIKIEDYSYSLPESRIAKFPVEKRDESKLLFFKDNLIQSHLFNQLPELLQPNDLLVFNNARVIQARLEFFKETGARIEIFCLEPYLPLDYNLSFQVTESCQWKCLVGNLKKWKDEILVKEIEFKEKRFILKVTKGNQSFEDGSFLVDFSWQLKEKDSDVSLTFGDILELSGHMPLPPYLNRKEAEEDKTRYQTVYARVNGSVAAPTAGLHFTEYVFNSLKTKGVDRLNITLHVSAGTFRPVKSQTLEDHHMHEESFEVELVSMKQLMAQKGRRIAVGTTSVRTLESIYWIGVKLLLKEENPFSISQWEIYNTKIEITVEDALKCVLNYLKDNNLQRLKAKTSIMIVPGYRFRMVEGLITNFHQPQSTLLLLIAAFTGDNWKKIYQFALENDYRFLSYGDSSFLLNSNPIPFS
ncbi:MAG: S-adenosylmethionine:tRNA ribosyltransferase-isomerase [Bacteroidales bacterium]